MARDVEKAKNKLIEPCSTFPNTINILSEKCDRQVLKKETAKREGGRQRGRPPSNQGRIFRARSTFALS